MLSERRIPWMILSLHGFNLFISISVHKYAIVVQMECFEFKD